MYRCGENNIKHASAAYAFVHVSKRRGFLGLCASTAEALDNVLPNFHQVSNENGLITEEDYFGWDCTCSCAPMKRFGKKADLAMVRITSEKVTFILPLLEYAIAFNFSSLLIILQFCQS